MGFEWDELIMWLGEAMALKKAEAEAMKEG
jgi:hypothetical protein